MNTKDDKHANDQVRLFKSSFLYCTFKSWFIDKVKLESCSRHSINCFIRKDQQVTNTIQLTGDT